MSTPPHIYGSPRWSLAVDALVFFVFAALVHVAAGPNLILESEHQYYRLIAATLAEGEAFPWHGPAVGNLRFHLPSTYYQLLAALQLVSKHPLVPYYLSLALAAGAAVVVRRLGHSLFGLGAGAFAVGLLLVDGHVAMVLTSQRHAAFAVLPLTLAVAGLLRWVESGSNRALLGTVVALLFALHFHFISAVLALACVAAAAVARRRVSGAVLIDASAIALLLYLPYLFHVATSDELLLMWRNLGGVGAHLTEVGAAADPVRGLPWLLVLVAAVVLWSSERRSGAVGNLVKALLIIGIVPLVIRGLWSEDWLARYNIVCQPASALLVAGALFAGARALSERWRVAITAAGAVALLVLVAPRHEPWKASLPQVNQAHFHMGLAQIASDNGLDREALEWRLYGPEWHAQASAAAYVSYAYDLPTEQPSSPLSLLLDDCPRYEAPFASWSVPVAPRRDLYLTAYSPSFSGATVGIQRGPALAWTGEMALPIRGFERVRRRELLDYGAPRLTVEPIDSLLRISERERFWAALDASEEERVLRADIDLAATSEPRELTVIAEGGSVAIGSTAESTARLTARLTPLGDGRFRLEPSPTATTVRVELALSGPTPDALRLELFERPVGGCPSNLDE